MKAAVMTRYAAPLEIQQLPAPVPGPRDALIRVAACGICRSDWHLWQRNLVHLGLDPALPFVPGHEFGGVVEAVGADIHHFTVGERVSVPFHLACGHCEYCLTGRSNVCLAYGIIGVHHSGGYGQQSVVPNADVNLVHLPDDVDFVTAAALGCRYMTAFHGVGERARLRPGEWVAVFGIGGIGIASVQIAAAMGARVLAVSRSDDKLQQAKAEGAEATVRAGDDAVAAIKDITGGGADVTIDALGIPKTVLPAILALKKSGRMVRMGFTNKEEAGVIALPVDAMTAQELEFIGSWGCPVTSYPRLLSMVATGKLNPRRLVDRTVPVEEVSAVLETMTDYRTRGFNVINAW
ncbi:MAG: alcohol dehydrogenase catalytic domain-containing protein [Chloroflexota bacterium]